MYSKKILNKIIEQQLYLKGMNLHGLAKQIGVTQTNLSRALNQDAFNLTLPQFSMLVEILELTPEQTFYILTGKKKKEADLQLIKTSIEKLLS